MKEEEILDIEEEQLEDTPEEKPQVESNFDPFAEAAPTNEPKEEPVVEEPVVEEPATEAAPTNDVEVTPVIDEKEIINEEPSEKVAEANPKKVDKEKMLENTHNLTEDIQEVKKQTAPEEEDTPDDKSVIIFIAFIFIFLALFVLALPTISRIFN